MSKKRSVKSFYLPQPPQRLSANAASTSSKAAGPEAASSRKIPTTAIDWSFTLRPVNLEHIERLAGASRLPPIAVWEFQPGRYRGIDGYHRWRLAKHRGESVVEATVHRFPAGPAGEQAFEFEAVRSNLQHGLPLSREERNRAIARLWRRWGRSEARPDGHTLDEIGQLFNLTKQRVHQILLAQQSPDAGASAAAQSGGREPARKLDVMRPAARHPGEVVRSTGTGRAGRPGRFSTLGRFSAATRRMRNLLRDDPFMAALWRQHRIEALAQLRELHGLIDDALASGR